MSTDQSPNFQGIDTCISSFASPACLTKTIEFILSSILFLTGLVLLYHCVRFFGFKGKIYISLSLFFMLSCLLINMVFCFWNTVYELYSIETYFHNLYFLSIVVYTTKSYLIKQKPKSKLSFSRASQLSNDSNEQEQGVFDKIKRKIINNGRFYKILYKAMALIFFLLFTLVFITSLIGDVKAKQKGQNLDQNQGAEKDYTLFSFIKNSCQQLWYLCVNALCVFLSLIVMIVLYKNYNFEKEKIKALTLVTSTIHQKNPPFNARSTNSSYSNKIKTTDSNIKIHNPLGKLALWMGINVLGEIINIIQSGLLLQADASNECRIIPNNQKMNSILMLLFVIGSVYSQYSITMWFFFKTLKQKSNVDSKNQKLLQSHEYSQEIRVGQIEMNPSLGQSNNSATD